MVPQAPASPMGNAGARLNRPISRQSSASKSSSADGPSGGAGIAASSSAEAGAAPQFEGTDEQLWLLRHFSLELFRIFVVQAPGEAIMPQPASEESLRLCPTKLAPNEYVTLTGSPHDLSGVMEMVPEPNKFLHGLQSSLLNLISVQLGQNPFLKGSQGKSLQACHFLFKI